MTRAEQDREQQSERRHPFAQPLGGPGTRVLTGLDQREREHRVREQHARTGPAQWLSEGVATFGLLLTILLGARHRASALPALVASWIFAAYWFTASTSFANPAVTLARSLTDTFAGIRPDDVAGFVLAQLAGALAAWLVAPRLTLERAD